MLLYYKKSSTKVNNTGQEEVMQNDQVLKKVGMLAASALLITGLMMGNALANRLCPNVTIDQAGAKTDGNAVRLTNIDTATVVGWPVNETRWFTLDPDNEDALLATALTALASGNALQMCPKVPNDFAAWHQIGQLYVSPTP